MIADELHFFSKSKIVDESVDLNSFSNVIDIPKIGSINVSNMRAVVNFYEIGGDGSFKSSKVLFVVGSTLELTAQHLKEPEVEVIVSDDNPEFFKVYVSARKRWNIIYTTVEFQSMPNALIAPKISPFETLRSGITKEIAVTFEIGNKFLNDMNGGEEAISFVSSTSHIEYPYTIKVNGFSGEPNNRLPNDSLSTSWVVEYVPTFNQGVFSTAIQTWTAVLNEIEYIYTRKLDAHVWSKFVSTSQNLQRNIGGTNLLRSTNDITRFWGKDTGVEYSESNGVISAKATGAPNPRIFNTSTQEAEIVVGEFYTLSFYAKANKSVQRDVRIADSAGVKFVMQYKYNVTNQWKKYVYIFKPINSIVAGDYQNLLYTVGDVGTNDTTSTLDLKKIKLEEGVSATSWVHNFKDIIDLIAAKVVATINS